MRCYYHEDCRLLTCSGFATRMECICSSKKRYVQNHGKWKFEELFTNIFVAIAEDSYSGLRSFVKDVTQAGAASYFKLRPCAVVFHA